tara:strand:- start:240 stop:773 length:534 start_codon:yes stop_codon:yes gene_type:complete
MDTSRYQNGLIYKLCSKDPTIKDCYVGSTCNFTKRKWGHKSKCNNEKDIAYNFNVYKFIRDHGGWDNWDMIELIKYPCNTKRELALKEREYLEMLGGTLNNCVPSQGQTEQMRKYREANKEEINEKAKAYYQTNKKEINEKQRERIKCECGGRFTKQNKSTHLKSLNHQKYLNEIKE